MGGGGSIQSGRFAGKMIVVEAMMDETCSPWQADWYRSRVQEALGDGLDDHYRVWFVEHAMHTSPTVAPDDPRPVRTTRAVSYAGVLQQALRDLSAWVEQGRVPPASTRVRGRRRPDRGARHRGRSAGASRPVVG